MKHFTLIFAGPQFVDSAELQVLQNIEFHQMAVTATVSRNIRVLFMTVDEKHFSIVMLPFNDDHFLGLFYSWRRISEEPNTSYKIELRNDNKSHIHCQRRIILGTGGE